jgi:hypothetical protein
MIFLDYDFGVRAEAGRFFSVFDPTGERGSPARVIGRTGDIQMNA